VTGNLNSNAIFNPNEIPPPTDLIESERDSELEKYIRNKYQFRKLMQTNRGFSSSSKMSQRTSSDLASTSSRPFSNSPTVAAGQSRVREVFNLQEPRGSAPKTSLSATAVNPSPSTAPTASRSSAPLLIDPTTSSQTQQPPLQILAPAPTAQPVVPQVAAAPTFVSSLHTQPQSVAQGVWGDMMAIQSGPAPVPQQQPLLFAQPQQQYLPPTSGVGVGFTPTFTSMPTYGAMPPPGVVSPMPSTLYSSLSPQMGTTMNGMMLPQATGMYTTASPQILPHSTPSPSLFPSLSAQPPVQMQVPMITAAPTPNYHSMQPHAVFQSMMPQQQQPFGAVGNQHLYTGTMPATGGVHPQQPFVGVMNPGMAQQWPGNATNPYASGAPQGQWYG
jgi:stromal membrane-associated protein